MQKNNDQLPAKADTPHAAFRDSVLEQAVAAMARNSWNVFVYYPEHQCIWLPDEVAARLHVNTWHEDAPRAHIPRFVSADNIPRYLNLFERINAGERFAHEIFLTSFLINSYAVSLSAATRDAQDRVTAAIGKITPMAVENANRKYLEVSHSTDDQKSDPLQKLIRGIAAQYYAIYDINLTDGTYVCYQERLNGILDLIGQKGKFRPAWDTYIRTSIAPEDRETVRRFADFDTLAERLMTTDRLSVNYRRLNIGWTRGSFIVTARNPEGCATDILYTVTDISREVALQEKATKAEYEANHDSLTGLYNRKAFDTICTNPQDYASRVALLLLDIDRFKDINDTYGHEAGDEVLKRVASVIRTLFRGNDDVVRLGGDEFAVILQNCDAAFWPVLCRKLPLLSMGLQHILPDGKSVSMSGGICFSEKGFVPELYPSADKALYHTKAIGRAGCSLISGEGEITGCWRDSFAQHNYTLSQKELIEISMEAMLRNTDEFAFIKDKNFVYVAASEAFARELADQESAAAVIGKTDFDIMDGDRIAQKYRDDDCRIFLSGESKITVRERYPSRSGRRRWCETTKYLLRDHAGEPTGIFGVCFDITDQVEMEEARKNDTDAQVSEALTNLFYATYRFDLTDNRVKLLRVPDRVRSVVGGITDLPTIIEVFLQRFVSTDYRTRVAQFMDLSTLPERLRGFQHLDCEYLSIMLDTWFRCTLMPMEHDADGRCTTALFVITRLDEANIRNIEENLSYKRNMLALFNNVPGGLVLYRWDGRDLKPIYISRHYARLYGESLTADHGGPDYKRVHPDDVQDYIDAVRKALPTAKTFEHTFRAWNKDLQRYIWVKLNAVSEDQPDGTRLVYAMFSDVTTEADNERRSVYASEHDPLTGLWNRTKIFSECRRLLKEHPDEEFAMLHFDIRQFRLYNTFYGEKAGDRLLKDIADMFRGMDKDYDFWAYGRIEADVFCVFFPIRRNKYQKHLNDLVSCLNNYRDDCVIESVIGIYTVTDPKMPIESMFARATIAAKKVKSGSGTHIVFFDEPMEHEIGDAQIVTNEIQYALENEEFQLWLQPKYALETCTVTGAEALVRWQHPERGLIPPKQFIPVLERNGWITKLDRYMWEHTCALLQKWQRTGMPMVPVSVNVSRISMYSQMTVPFLQQLVTKYGIDPKYLQLELTESAFMDDPVDMYRQLRELQDFGFTILIDDFGTGYSSLNTLRQLPADILKLDMGFLPKSREDRRGCAIVSAVIRMCRDLGLAVIAEGVETPEQADYLSEYGCPQAQGYLFARPMPAEDFEMLITDR